MKIALINHLPHNYIGGVESYSRRLLQILVDEGHLVHEYSTLKQKDSAIVSGPIKSIKQIDISNGADFYRKSATKDIKKISPEYDIVIHNCLMVKENYKSKNSIYVQHVDNKKYSWKSPDWWFTFFNFVFLRIGYWKNPLSSDNVVFFSKGEDTFNVKNPLYVTTPLIDFKIINRTGFGAGNSFWMARHEEPHKGLKNLVKISKELDNELLIAGNGPHTSKLKNVKGKLVGKLDRTQITEKFMNSKVFLLTSNYEGFPITIIEALSFGVPVVMFDSFTSASIVKDCKAVKLIKKGDHASFIKEVNKIEKMNTKEWLTLSKEASLFAKKNFSPEIFKKSWVNYINKIDKKIKG